LTLKNSLRSRPVIYEIVPPRRDTSRFHTELKGVEDVLSDSRITAINVPELINRREERGRVRYAPATIPPEEYALMVKEYKESIVNIIAPRLARDEFLRRARRVLHDYRIPNLVLVGRERHDDILPGPGVLEAFQLLKSERIDHVTLGGICIFDRRSSRSNDYSGKGRNLGEPERVWMKASAGCDFVTSQITFDSRPALDFLAKYQELCERNETKPVTVFISFVTIPSLSILALIESLDVHVPRMVGKRLKNSDRIGKESVRICIEILQEILAEAKERQIRVPLGVQVEQVGVNNGDLSLELLDAVHPLIS
jgi:hypothetical protein